MALSDEHQKIVDTLYTSYKSNGFLKEDETLNLLSENNISLRDTDHLIDVLLSKGVIFSSGTEQIDDEEYADFSFTDYSSVFSEIIKTDAGLKPLINYISKIKPPQRHEFDKLIVQANDGNLFAKNRIIEMNMRQAVRHALYFHKKFSYPLDDCIQEAFLGLILGFEKYNINKSHKFGIHITWWIRQNLYREILVGNYLIRIPSHFKSHMYKLVNLFMEKSESYKEENKETIISKIITKISCTKENAMNIYKCFQNTIDIEELELSDDASLINNLEHYITNTILNEKIIDILSTMPPRETEVLLMRFGINNDKEYTLDEIGSRYGVTRERVRQIEARALRRIRHPKRSRALAKFLPDHEIKELSDEDLPKGQKFIE